MLYNLTTIVDFEMVIPCLYVLIKMVFPFCSSLSYKHSVKGNGQKESRNRKNSRDLPASEYYKIYQQTKQLNKQKSSSSDNELVQNSPVVRRRSNDSELSTDSELYSNHNESFKLNKLRSVSSSLGELNTIENMDSTTTISGGGGADIKVKGGIAER